MASGITLPENAPLSSYTRGSVVRVWRYGHALRVAVLYEYGGTDSVVRVWRYGHALRALRAVVVQSGCEPSGFALPSLRIGAATKLAAGGDVSDRAIPRKGRWARDSNTSKIYTKGNTVDPQRVCKKLVQVGEVVPRLPGQGTV